MPQPRKGPSLGAHPSHQRLMLRNLARSLFEHERITTTEAKARMLSPYAERLITKAKGGTVHQRRQVLSALGDRAVTHKLFAEIAPRFATRSGGYTRVLKIGPRGGDGAPMALIELLEGSPAGGSSSSTDEESRRRRLRRPGRRRGAAAQDLPQDKPARSRAAEAGAAGGAPPGAELPPEGGGGREEAGDGGDESVEAAESPETAADATPDAGAEGEGPSGAGGAPGRQGG